MSRYDTLRAIRPVGDAKWWLIESKLVHGLLTLRSLQQWFQFWKKISLSHVCMGVSENSVPQNPLGYHHFPCIAMLGCPDTSIIRLWMKLTDAPSVHKDIARFHLLRFTPNVRDLPSGVPSRHQWARTMRSAMKRCFCLNLSILKPTKGPVTSTDLRDLTLRANH